MNCNHDRLLPQCAAYLISDEETGEVLTRTVHVSVSCGRCGVRFRFEGLFAPRPHDRDGLLAATMPWTDHDGLEVGMRFSENPPDAWAAGPPAGVG